ncbi:hypothetical protein SAMN02799622_03514 [Methylobacterium sp. UNC378MF]|uniref:hypothetical protein n=1 Tax=Methylobacterium sp. UNC378MF TaxID=1502748 RepID=UPI0008863517|nr:hypothetical protein [Methylobacterium sp. UNC378MF]SDA24931.1 hypothetical protein SAMN02799622_03514 [Methylobacterium sp. UNC378MF]
MSFIDEIRNDLAGWFARARAEPEDALVSTPGLSLSADDAERLEEVVSGKSPSYGRPLISAGAAAMGRAEPDGDRWARANAARITGERLGAFTSGRDQRDEKGRRAG